MCHLNLYVKKWGSPSSFRRKRPFISLNNSAFIENLLSSEVARARARANHAKNNAQKGCVMQLNGITLRPHPNKGLAEGLSVEPVYSGFSVVFSRLLLDKEND